MHIQEEVILSMLCKKHNWLYLPKEETGSPKVFAATFPDLFDYGYDQNFDEQIWGTIQSQTGIERPFWYTKFTYVVQEGRSSKVKTEHVYIIQLQKPVEVEFTLAKAGIFSKFEESIKTESVDFNNAYVIKASSSKGQDMNEIIKILNPSVQIRLVDFSHKYTGIKSLSFKLDLLIISFHESIWKTRYTNFFKSVSIDMRDEENFNKAFLDMIAIPEEMLHFIQ